MSHLSEKYRKACKDTAIPSLNRDEWLSNHKTKTIEQRKLSIETFLQIALQSQEIRLLSEKDQSHNILKDLQLPRDFYELPFKLDKAGG